MIVEIYAPTRNSGRVLILTVSGRSMHRDAADFSKLAVGDSVRYLDPTTRSNPNEEAEVRNGIVAERRWDILPGKLTLQLMVETDPNRDYLGS